MAVDPLIYTALFTLLVGRAREESGFLRFAILLQAWVIGILGIIYSAAELLGVKP